MVTAGKALLTSQRLLMLSCQPTSAGDISVSGSPEQGNRKGTIILSYKAANSVSYRPVTLKSFRSIAMMMETSTTGEATISKKADDLSSCFCCLSCCSCCDGCCDNVWRGSSFSTATSDRYLELDYEGP